MTKKQRQFADNFLEKNPQFSALYFNPAKGEGEWFTDIDYANNSLEKDKDGKVIGEIETVERAIIFEKETVIPDVIVTTAGTPGAEDKKSTTGGTEETTGSAANTEQNPK